MPFPLLIPIILKAIAALTVVTLVVVSFDAIVTWFRDRNAIKVADKDNIAFTIKQNIENGKHKVIQGIFNERTGAVVDGQVFVATELDAKLQELHNGTELVIYK